jgi:uncharacterized protein YbbK (DUF523 family)
MNSETNLENVDKWAVSACLMGVNCKYSGGNNENSLVKKFLDGKNILMICPEVAGGLSTPRDPSEIIMKDGTRRVITSCGKDLTDCFSAGARTTLKQLQGEGITHALLKARSPSCGYKTIYDGTFTHTVIEGSGIAAELFAKNGIEMITEEDLCDFFVPEK